MAVEDRRVDIDREAFCLGCLDRRDRLLENALLRDRLVVMFLQPIEMDREEQVGGRLEQVQLLFEESALVQSETNFLRATMPLTISPISRWMSGSPPGIATIGAPHSSTASRHSLTDSAG